MFNKIIDEIQQKQGDQHEILLHIKEKVDRMSQATDHMKNAVASITSAERSLAALIGTLTQKIRDANAAEDAEAAINALADEIDGDTKDIVGATLANTEAAPTVVELAPVETIGAGAAVYDNTKEAADKAAAQAQADADAKAAEQAAVDKAAADKAAADKAAAEQAAAEAADKAAADKAAAAVDQAKIDPAKAEPDAPAPGMPDPSDPTTAA